MVLLAGTRLGPYEIQSSLGAGGMGEIYKARDTRLDRIVAIKILPEALAADPQFRVRFDREARTISQLDHPHICALYDVGDQNGTAYLVMQYLEGETLADRLTKGALPLDQALQIAVQIADALATAHEAGIVHRDLKPGNIMLTKGGAKLLDFGLAKTVVAETAVTAAARLEQIIQTRAGHFLGTPAYMSPEQLRGRGVDHRTDIYSFGVVLFEMTTGARPFAATDVLTLGLNVLTDAPPRARAIDPSIRPALDALMARMLEKDPADRPQSASEIKAALIHVLGGAGVHVAYGRWTLVGAVIVALVTTGVLWWRRPQAVRLAERPVIVVLPLTNLTGDSSKDYLGVGIADTLTTHLARLSSVSVVTRPTTADSQKQAADPVKLARDLGANLLLEGSLQLAGGRLKVNAKLMKPDGTVTWAGESEASVTELFSIESLLATALIDALEVGVSAAERQDATRPPTTNPDALSDYWQGVTLLDRIDTATLDSAIVRLERAVSRDPPFALAHARLGDAYRRKYAGTNDRAWMTKAISEVSRATELDPHRADVRLSLAGLYRATGRNGAAVDELRRVTAEQPTNDDAHRQLAGVLGSEGQQEEAIAEFQKAIAIRPSYWSNHYTFGLFYYGAGRTKEAVAEFTRSIELRPDDSDGYVSLGAAYYSLGDSARARDNFKRAIALNPNTAAYSNLGTIDYADGRYADAASAYQAAIKLRPNYPLYHRNLGDAYLKLGKPRDARDEYEKAVKLSEEMLSVNPNEAMTLARLGVYEAKLGRRQEAERHIVAAVAINPTSPQVAYYRAVVLTLNGQQPAAMKALSEAIARGYSIKLLLEDDDLARLKNLPEFQALVRPHK